MEDIIPLTDEQKQKLSDELDQVYAFPSHVYVRVNRDTNRLHLDGLFDMAADDPDGFLPDPINTGALVNTFYCDDPEVAAKFPIYMVEGAPMCKVVRYPLESLLDEIKEKEIPVMAVQMHKFSAIPKPGKEFMIDDSKVLWIANSDDFNRGIKQRDLEDE